LSEGRNKSALARALGVSRASLYDVPQRKEKDGRLKVRLEQELPIHPCYGSRRLAAARGLCRQRVPRVMRLLGIKPYRRRGRKGRKSKVSRASPNFLLSVMPAYTNHLWAADFTELVQHGKKIDVATVIDLCTRRIMGIHVAVRKGAALTIQALSNALLHHPRPGLFHSDNGKEYDAMAFTGILDGCGIMISRSRPGCPWENGYQESFYYKFKVDLGDPNRFKTLGELVAQIYRTLWDYNNTRIRSALNMPPVLFAKQYALVA
jgi:putative transposase